MIYPIPNVGQLTLNGNMMHKLLSTTIRAVTVDPIEKQGQVSGFNIKPRSEMFRNILLIPSRAPLSAQEWMLHAINRTRSLTERAKNIMFVVLDKPILRNTMMLMMFVKMPVVYKTTHVTPANRNSNLRKNSRVKRKNFWPPLCAVLI